jgi:hypothetical protein
MLNMTNYQTYKEILVAKIINQHVVINLSKLVKDNSEESASLVSEDFVDELEAVVQELVNKDIIVEVQNSINFTKS